MENIQIQDKLFKPYISSGQIAEAVGKVARAIRERYPVEEIVFLAILNGSFMFAADLLRCFDLNSKVIFIKLASYEGDHSTGQVRELIGLGESLEDRVVVVLEDIVDTGNTLVNVMDQLEAQRPRAAHVASLLFKPEAYKKDRPIDFHGIAIPNKFIVGYGLDYNGYGRNLPDIYQVV